MKWYFHTSKIFLSVFILLICTLSNSTRAQTINGSPPELEGTFVSNKNQCIKFDIFSSEAFTIIETTKKGSFMTFCSGTACESRIVSYQKSKKGYILNMTSKNNPHWQTEIYKEDEFTFLFPGLAIGKAPPVKLIKCH